MPDANPAADATEYQPRIVDALLAQRLRSAPCVVLEGARACGKTATARQQAASEVLFDTDPVAVELARLEPKRLIEGPEPRLFDEWQVAPEIWNHLRRASDDGGRPGRFILTGSAVPADDVSRHTGAGRMSRIRMRPMSLFETGLSTGEVSLGGLLRAEDAVGSSVGLTLDHMVDAVCRGGWPGLLGAEPTEALRFVRDYLDETRRVEIANGGGRRRDPARLRQLLQSLARNVASEVSMATLAADAGGENPLDTNTVRGYLDDLERIFVVEDQPAWSVQLRSRSRLRSAPKRHFVDPSLAVAALRAGPERLLADLGFFGLLFESLVVRDLRIYASVYDGEVRHYRDNTGLEVDVIVENGAGEWLAAEVKLGGTAAINEAAGNLLKLRDRVDTSIVGLPTKLVVLTAFGYAYDRPDGIAVVPITTLGP